MHEKRRFPRFPMTNPVLCSRYGRQMTMRTLNISQGGLRLEANFDLGVGESIDFAILTNSTRIQCKGRVLAIEEFPNKVQARLRFAPSSDWENGKLSNYLRALSQRPFQKGLIGDSAFSLLGATRHAMTEGMRRLTGIFSERQQDKKLQMVNSWLALLTDMERAVIRLRFGLNGENTHTSESIGRRLGITTKIVHQIEEEAIEKLRKMSRKKEIDLDDVI